MYREKCSAVDMSPNTLFVLFIVWRNSQYVKNSQEGTCKKKRENFKYLLQDFSVGTGNSHDKNFYAVNKEIENCEDVERSMEYSVLRRLYLRSASIQVSAHFMLDL